MPAVPEHWNKCEVAHGHVKWLLEHAQLTTAEQVLVRSIDGTVHELQSVITGLEERLSAALVRADLAERTKQIEFGE